ncbi:rhomboid family intramembrane serine protease [Neptunitalea chrysea]|uniref:Rhomboid family intramembrane serine protease n=1 Tax=Neptunitalea chrysea TaxID=1647581 RepID=A0A9W6EW37_9FLAO|nr:rhomboid family intramembrane serine protease [Neptunitalea chrysea]GLB53317.1 rhomboid family intramembrane serine protease [Neptunitalea chrysea]
MSKFKQTYAYYSGVVLYPLYLVVAMWVAFYVDVIFNLHAYEYGIYPRTLMGLKGVFLSPFIHGSLKHLYSNTLPLLFLSAALFYFYRKISWKVFLSGYLLTGIITWLIARSSFHIGMSGVIYFLSSFIFFKGIFSKHFRLIAVSLIVVFMYGSTIWYVLPIKEGMSWEGHLAGFITGLLLAYFVKVPEENKPVYEWQKPDYVPRKHDMFMKHFDDDGNFVSESKQLEQLKEELNKYDWNQIEYKYTYKENKDDNNE